MPTFVIANDSAALASTLYENLSADSEFYVLMPCSAELLSKFLTGTKDSEEDPVLRLLSELSVPAHKTGYRQLMTAIPLFAKDPRQSLSKEIYPAVAAAIGCGDWKAVEHSIRRAILSAWQYRDPTIWSKYFSDGKKPPSNKLFISVLARHIL